MTRTDQNQKVASSGIAIQSGGDTNISNGVSTEQIQEIIQTLSDQLPKYAAIAAGIVDQRLKEFEKRIIEKFEVDDQLNREAFCDPDFQFLLLESQKNYARSGDRDSLGLLEELLAERSKCAGASRQALTINRAVTIVPQLTCEEISILSISFAVKQVKLVNPYSLEIVGNFLKKAIDPFVDNFSDNYNAYKYIESVGCGVISMGEISLPNAIISTYDRLLRRGRDMADVARDAQDHFEQLIGCGIFELRSGFVHTNIDDPEQFKIAVENSGISLDEAQINSYLSSITSCQNLDQDEVIDRISEEYANFREISDKWSFSEIKKLNLTSVGSAIGYMSLRRYVTLPDIGIWVN